MRRWVRVLLRALQFVCVRLANLGRPPRALRHQAEDLLRASRVAARIEDGDSVLDVGCGSGHVLAELKLFRRIRAVGVDLATDRVAFGDLEISRFDGQSLPFADGAFDVTLVCYVLHHLSPEDAAALMREVVRVTRRRVILHEDSLAEFGPLYRLRNRLHRVEAGLEYGAESSEYRPLRGEAMFLTHDGWRGFLGGFERVAGVAIEPLDEIYRYRHHTLIDVTLSGATSSTARPS